jgi:hypothetical protein
MDAYDSHLVLSFVGETRLLAISEEDVLDEATIAGFDGDSQTLLAATTRHDQLLQVRRVAACCLLFVCRCGYVPLLASGHVAVLLLMTCWMQSAC